MKNILENPALIRLQSFFTGLWERLCSFKIFNFTVSRRLIIIGFCVLVALLAVLSAVISLSEGSEDRQEQTTLEELSQADFTPIAEEEQLEVTLLNVFLSSDRTELISAVLYHVDTEQSLVEYRFLDTDTFVTVDSVHDSPDGHLVTGGTKQLIRALTLIAGEEPDRYIIGDDSSVLKLMELLGDTTVEIPCRISHQQNGVSYIIDEGTQVLTPDMLLKYYLYLVSEPGVSRQSIAELELSLCSRLLKTDSEEPDSLFCTAIGYFETDISALDFNNSKGALLAVEELACVQAP